MPKISIIKTKEGQTKYSMLLPKELMESMAVKKGDKLNLTSVAGDQITFRLARSI